MNWFKQTLLVLIVVLAALGAWVRYDPSAAAFAKRLGVPDALIARIAKSLPQQDSAGERPGGGASRGERGEGTPVVTSLTGAAAINDRVSAIGDGEALRSVTVVPRSEGILTEVRVEAGEHVDQGEVLAVLDLESETIVRDQAELAVKISEDKVKRYEQLVESRAVSQVQLIDARNELANARLNLQSAQLALERRSITAPIAGIVGILPVEAGDYVTEQTEIATIDDRTSLNVDFWVPERFASIVEVGQSVDAEPIAMSGVTFPGVVTAIASRVDKVSRTLQIRARIDNREDQLRPGMSFKVNLYFSGDHYVAVDPLAIQWSSSGPYVWKIESGKPSKTAVQIVQRNADYVLISGDIAQGDEVIIEGLQSLRPGSAIKITRRSSAPTSEGS